MPLILKVMPRLPVNDLHATIESYTGTLGFATGPLWPADVAESTADSPTCRNETNDHA